MWGRLASAACGAALAGLMIGAPRLAAAAGFEIREQSAVGQGASFAGAAARGDDPSFLFFNPASMAWLEGIQSASVASAIFPSAQARNGSASRAAVLGNTPITGSLGGDPLVDAFVPSFHGTLPIAPDWRFGLSVSAPFGLVTKYPVDFIGRYRAYTSSLKTVDIAPALSWRPMPSLALGAALLIQYADARLSNAVDFGSIGALAGLGRLGFAPGAFDGRTTLSGDSWAVGWQIGAQWEVRPGTMLGFAYRSPIFHDLRGDVRFDAVPPPLNRSPAFADGGARAKFTSPDSITLGVTQLLTERWRLLLGAEWTNWSRFHELVTRFDNGRPASITEERWQPNWFLSIGTEYRVTEAVTLRTGFAWDKTPVPQVTRDPRIADSNRYWLSVGATWQVLQRLALSIGYTHIFADDARVRL
ncbi:MAG TPA: outer membrane protein transport protein, partial [Crenalkalicoccus sp.]|nr:outer membrane protein transport protein [Crenalkalicoccus sp.]